VHDGFGFEGYMDTKSKLSQEISNLNLKVELRSTSDLIPYARNSRVHSEKQIAQIAASIREFGFVDPILIDGEKTIIAGHGRLEAAFKLNMPEVPTIQLTHLSTTQKRALVIAHNKIALNADFDKSLLSLELGDLNLDDFNMSITGFDKEELQELLTFNVTKEEPKTEEDAVPEPPAQAASMPGDIWICGDHRVMCGDSLVLTNVLKLLDGSLADMVFTDPPYNLAVCGGDHNPQGRTFGKGPKIQNDDMPDADFQQFLLDAFTIMYQAVQPGAVIYVCHADSEGLIFRQAFKDSGLLMKQVLVWAKQQFVFSRQDYHWQHESILYGWKPGGAHKFYGEKNQGTVWNIDRPMRSEKEHPTQKPVALPVKAISNSTQSQNNIVLDPFGGSGSTLIACESTGRKGRLMELEPRYVDLIVTRWQQHTGKTATLQGDGRTFEQLKSERLPLPASAG